MTASTPGSFNADVSTAVADQINRHRNTDAFSDDDRQLAITLGKILNPDAHSGDGCNAVISRAIQDGDRAALTFTTAAHRERAELAGFLDGLPVVSQRDREDALRKIENLLALQVRLHALGIGFERDGEAVAHAKQDLAAVRRGDFDEIGPRHEPEAFDLAEDGLGDVVGDRVPDPAVNHRDNVSFHSSTPSLHGLVTRYVTGAIPAASRWLQRRAWVRRAVDSSPRPSGTTGASS